ncbi:zinc-ribbon and DUF3426 domain-containing protein [Luteibacter sp.]|jgi:predicted Zn finger-like uncharacterized protein|uniref:zinc-ribbon and DUF3426 domain-containing protein n=1 Tax=Luteibacter sp. TaxID=1886636 RepID=UPI002F400CD1
MYTQCPGCLTVYKLEAELLVPACGCLRCGHCDGVFNALGTLATHLPPEPFTRLAGHALDQEPPLADVAVFRPRPVFDDLMTEPAAEPAEESIHGPLAAEEPSEDFSQLTFTPRFAKPRRRSWRTAAWATVCTVLVLGLGAQLGWAKRDVLIADPTVGPLIETGCAAIGCRLPLVSAPARLRLLARDVEQHPSASDGLLITASVRNDAAFAQPYPIVTIVLSDANGQRLAMRRFQPEDYVGDAATRTRGLAGGATTAMVFEVQDPGQRAVAFAFSFD